MSKPIEEVVYSICNDFIDADEKVEKIKKTIESYVLEKEKDKSVPKTLDAQIRSFRSYMLDIIKGNISTKKYFAPRLMVYNARSVAYFGEGGLVFCFESNSQFVRKVPKEFVLNVDKDPLLISEYELVFEKLEELKSKEREFKLTMTYPELMAIKKLAKGDNINHNFEYFLKEIYNINDNKDIIHRRLNVFSVYRVFKILGIDSITFNMTDDFRDAMIIEGYNDKVGSYTIFMTFIAEMGGEKDEEYDSEMNKRREKIKSAEIERENIIKDIKDICKKNKKVKINRIIKELPDDIDLPF